MISIGVEKCVLHSLIDKKSICENLVSSMKIGEFDRGLDEKYRCLDQSTGDYCKN